MKRQVISIVIACLLVILQLSLFSQVGRDTTGRDSTSLDFIGRIRKIGKNETIRSIERYQAGRVAIRQEQLLQEIRLTARKAKLYLSKSPDTSATRQYLMIGQQQLLLLEDGILTNKGTVYNRRNLAVTDAVLTEMLTRTNTRRDLLDADIQSTQWFIDGIDSLSMDSTLYSFPFDSLHTSQYLQRVALVAKELGPTDSTLRLRTMQLQRLLTDADLLVYNIRSYQEQVERYQDELEQHMFDQELPYLWEQPKFSRGAADIIDISAKKEKLALGFYVDEHRGRLLLLLAIILMGAYFIRSLKKRIREESMEVTDQASHLVLKSPLLSSLVVGLSIFQFMFLQPPYIFGFCIWLVAVTCLSMMLQSYLTIFWYIFWNTVIVLFFLAGIDNLVLEPFGADRWFMLLLSVAGVVFGLFGASKKRRSELREKRIIYGIGFMLVVECCAVVANLLGRYNLAKTLMVVGFMGLLVAILFLWAVRIMNETLRLVSGVYKHPDRRLFYLNFDRIGERVPGILYLFLIVGWLVLVSRNFYGFKKMSMPLVEFLTTERTIGEYTFTINGLFIFVVILSISALLSQLISFFAGDPLEPKPGTVTGRKPGVGSWLLLIRIFIISIGLFLAFAAAGIPLDRLTIILGALGVGIGLGLQGLVSNLVSGLIIAFEKPVNVGDIIELNESLGVMKSIGFRSSIVNMIDGPSLIVPNSDLLNQKLVNWTMGRNKRRLNVVVSVAYQSDLHKVREVLLGILKGREDVLQFPEPVVSVKVFNHSSVDIDLYFWIDNIRNTLPTRSAVIAQVHEEFRKEGIVIPFPQQDVYIKSAPFSQADATPAGGNPRITSETGLGNGSREQDKVN